MLEDADKIITFRCADLLPKKFLNKVENWEYGRKRKIGEKPLERGLDEIRQMRDNIYKRVEDLIKRLDKF